MLDLNRYSALSVNAQLALCLMAYMYGETRFFGHRSIGVKRCLSSLGVNINTVSKELVESGFITVETDHWDKNNVHYNINTEEVLVALLFLYKERKAWVKDFARFKSDYKYFDELRSLIRCYAEDTVMPRLNFVLAMDALSQVFAPHITDVALSPLFNSIYPEMFKYIVTTAVGGSLRNDKPMDYDALVTVIENYSCVDRDMAELLLGYAAMYRFFYDGSYKVDHLRPGSIYFYVVNAIRCMNHGDYKKALTLFAEALKLQNKHTEYKNIFLNAVPNYYLLLAYHIDGSAQSRTKLAQFCKKGECMHKFDMLSSRFLSEALNDNLKEVSFRSYNDFRGAIRLERHFAYLFSEYWEIPSSLKMAGGYPPPLYRIMRHELSEYLNLSDNERDELRSLYGDRPVLSSIYRKKQWETVFDNIESSIGKPAEKDEGDTRLAYILHGGGFVEVREQQRLRNGKWGAGKKVSDMAYLSGEISYMDETDRQIWKDHIRSGNPFLAEESVVPYMQGVPRLFYGRYAPFEPVNVTSEHLYFEIVKGKSSFKINSNVTAKELSLSCTDNGMMVRKISDTEYCVVEFRAEYKSLYRQILSLKSIPLEAESRMAATLQTLGSIVEVHSDMLEGGSSLECIAGSPVISVQIGAVAADVYNVSLKVRPLPDGTRLFVPGEGQAMISDEAAGVRYRVRRNIAEEKMNLRTISDVIENEVEVLAGNPESEFETTTVGLLAIMSMVGENDGICVLEWDSDKKLKLKKAVNPSDWNITMKSKNSWFEVEGTISLDDNTILSIAQIIQMLGSSKGRFVKLNDNEYIMLTDSLKKQLSRIESVGSVERGNKVQISAFGAATLDNSAFNGEFTVQADAKLKKLREAISSSAKMEFAVPNSLQATLRDYQADGFRWIARMDSWGAGVCLADDMGLGKTIQTIAFLLHKVAAGASLVVAPVSVVPNWKKELERFAPSLDVVVVNSTDDREAAIKDAGAGTVVLSSYGMLLTGNAFVEKEWNVVVLDEAHAIKNRDTKTSAAIMKLSCKSRLVLTGTPIQNNLGELWNLFQFANPGLLGGWEVFKRKYMQPIEEDKDKERQKQLKRLIQPFMLRRTKNDVLDDLPEKNEIVLPVELSAEELSVYEFIRKRAEDMLKEGGNKVEVQTLAEITRLRQAACCTSLVKKGWSGTCSKIDLLMSTLENITTAGNRTLLFSQFTSFLEIVRARLDETGIEYLYLDGSTTIKQREKLVQRFQQGETSLFIISLKAGGLGLNLTGANYVVHLDPWWNPAIEQQATDRAHRIGQQQKVTVYHLVSKNTIEEKILRLHQSKRNLADALLEGSDVSHRLTASDLLDMIGK